MLLVFDLDGTLVDSSQDLADSANALLASYDAPAQSVDRIIQMVGDGAAKLVERACTAAGLEAVPRDALPRFLKLYDERLLNHTRPYPGVVETLDEVAGRGPMAVLTNKPARPSRDILDGTGLLGYFDELVGGDGPLGRKPDPTGLRWLIDRAGRTPASALLIGDSHVDLLTARAVGTPFCLAGYGFGVAGVEVGSLGPTDWLIDRPLDLVARLEDWAG